MTLSLETIQILQEQIALSKQQVQIDSEMLLDIPPEDIEELSIQVGGTGQPLFIYGLHDPDTSGTYIP